jgi:hypothetical protein
MQGWTLALHPNRSCVTNAAPCMPPCCHAVPDYGCWYETMPCVKVRTDDRGQRIIGSWWHTKQHLMACFGQLAHLIITGGSAGGETTEALRQWHEKVICWEKRPRIRHHARLGTSMLSLPCRKQTTTTTTTKP